MPPHRARIAACALAIALSACHEVIPPPAASPRDLGEPSAASEPDEAAGREEKDDEGDEPESGGAPPSGVDAGPVESFGGGGKRTVTFEDAKQHLRRIYDEAGQTKTLYCACPYRGHQVDIAACGYAVQSDATRASRLEWEHVVPASAFGRSFAEWRVGHPSCVKKRRPYHGRKCAHHASPEFARIEGDMHNLFPEAGEINALRGDRMMGEIAGEARRYGACDFELTSALFEPRPAVRGEIARAYKYMEETYPGRGILPDGLQATMDAWDAADPPDAWERTRNEKIAALQGRRNRFIDRAPPPPTFGPPLLRAKDPSGP